MTRGANALTTRVEQFTDRWEEFNEFTGHYDTTPWKLLFEMSERLNAIINRLSELPPVSDQTND